MKPTIITLNWVPEFAHGYVKDLRIRWACEEAGISYDLKLITSKDQNTKEYRQIQPYGQVPAYEEGDIKMYESGAIVLHIGEKSEKLIPRNPSARARAITWVFSATNTLEPFVKVFTHVTKEGPAKQMLETRLNEVAAWLEGREYLEDQFSVGDIMMVTVLRDLGDEEVLTKNKILMDYLSRCESRPAFKKALNDQIETFKKNTPA